MKYSFLLFILVLSSLSCKKKDTVDQSALDEEIIAGYISDNHLNAKATGSGLYYVITNPGSGLQPASNSNVTVAYKGMLTNGTVFDQSAATGATFNLGQVIKGWTEGIPLFKKGGTGTLLIPSALGYGKQASGKIPANAVLIFEITLLDVK
jgi:FKBP-type peptidyl-prolyl cis-trans isomerase FkpA